MQRISWRSSFHNAWRVPTDQKEWTTIPNREAGKECFLWKDYSNSSQMFSLTENSTAIQRYFPPTTLAKIDPPERTLPHAGVGDTLRVHAAFASFECQSHTTLKISVVLHFRHCDCLSGVGTLWFLQGFSERDGSCLRGASWARAAPGHRPPLAVSAPLCLRPVSQGSFTYSAAHVFKLLRALNPPHLEDLLSFLLQPRFEHRVVLLFLFVLFLYFPLLLLAGRVSKASMKDFKIVHELLERDILRSKIRIPCP